MARLLFPDEGSRLAYRVSAGTLRSVSAAPVTVFTDAAGTVLADLREYDGTNTPGPVIAGSVLTIDQYSRLPLFWGPAADVDTLYAVIYGGPPSPMYARFDPRIDALEAAVGTGVYEEYGPSWTIPDGTGIQPNIGDGTLVGSFIRVGELIAYEIVLTRGTTTTLGTENVPFSQVYSFSLPTLAMTPNARVGGASMNFTLDEDYFPSYDGFAAISPNSAAHIQFGFGAAAWGPGELGQQFQPGAGPTLILAGTYRAAP